MTHDTPENLDLFAAPKRPPPPTTEAYARLSDPGTSHAAAASVRPTEMEMAVYMALSKIPAGATASELVERMGMAWNSVSPRFAPLVRKGFIRDSGERRPGPSNRKQIVWQVIPRREGS